MGGGRGHRDELVALLLLVVLAAGIALGALLLAPPGSVPLVGDEPASVETGGPPPSAAPVGAGVSLWDAPFVYACRLVPPDDVERIFGDYGQRAYVRQQFLDRTPSTAELDGASAFAYGGLATRCSHWFDDADAHSLEVVVTQFPSDRLAQRRWRRLDARAVDGAGGRLRYLPAESAFVVRARALLVQVRYAEERALRKGRGLSSGRAQAQEPRMREVLAAVDLHLADGSAQDGPLPTAARVSGTVGGTAYVEPCAVLDADAFAAIGAPRPEPVVVDTSVIRHDPYADSAVTSCERTSTVRGRHPRRLRSTFAVLEIRATPDPDAARSTLERHLETRYDDRVRPRPLDTDAGPAYVVDLATRANPLRARAVHLVVGAYELRLSLVLDAGPSRPRGRAPTDGQLAAAAASLAASLTTVTEEQVP